MEYIDPVLIELEKLNARLSKEQVSSIYSLIRFEYPDLIVSVNKTATCWRLPKTISWREAKEKDYGKRYSYS